MKIIQIIPSRHPFLPLKPTARICSMISVLRFLSRHLMLPTLLLLASFSQLAIAQDIPGLFVEGYAWPISAKSGEAVSLHVSTSATQFQYEIYRIGSESKPVKLVGSDKSSVYTGPGHKYPIPEKASAEGCGWPSDVKITIPPEWQSGYYEVRFTAQDSGGIYTSRGRRTAQSSCFFVVRPANPGTETKILLQLSTNTYNAYNNWGGFSLYAFNGKANNQGHKVSFLRPPSSQFGSWEQTFVSWAEKNGIKLDYATNEDLEYHPELLEKYKLVLSVGHDEYWSSKMRDHLEAFIAKGGNVAFFSGNSICWQVRPENNGTALTSWKQNTYNDPQYQTGDYKTLATLWSHHLIGRPENSLTGVGFLFGGYHLSHGHFMGGSGGYTIQRPKHWIFEGTNLLQGDLLGARHTVVGYECDGCEMQIGPDGLPVPTGSDGTPKNFEILATAPAVWDKDDAEWYEKYKKNRLGAAVLGTYTVPSGGTVVTAGSTDWAHGLRGGDPAIERITKNILEKLGR